MQLSYTLPHFLPEPAVFCYELVCFNAPCSESGFSCHSNILSIASMGLVSWHDGTSWRCIIVVYTACWDLAL